MPIIGAHVSTAGSLDLAFDRGGNIGAECLQIFISPPQQWVQVQHKPEVVENYLKKQAESKIGPNFIHGCYLINLATDNPENLKKGVDWLIYSLKTASKLGLQGTIFHLGSHKGKGFDSVKDEMVKALKEVLDNSPENVDLILENSAGTAIGGRLEELGYFIRTIRDRRLKVCIDTCHAFATGYDLRTKAGAEELVSKIDENIRLENLVVIHTNDSKFDLGAGRDRHENIGEGFIGREGFSHLLNHPKLKHLPFILEVPGFADLGPDAENIQTLQSLVTKI